MVQQKERQYWTDEGLMRDFGTFFMFFETGTFLVPLRCLEMAFVCLSGERQNKKNTFQIKCLEGVVLFCPRRVFISTWALRDSNPRPSACKADALNQLS